MQKIILIVGLPGSGKTTLGKNLAQSGILIDDISKFGLDRLIVSLNEFSTIVVTDCFLCLEKEREKAISFFKSKNIESIDWIFFENNPDKCLKNIQYRNDGRKVEGLIHMLSRLYTIPDDIIPKTIWTNLDLN